MIWLCVGKNKTEALAMEVNTETNRDTISQMNASTFSPCDAGLVRCTKPIGTL